MESFCRKERLYNSLMLVRTRMSLATAKPVIHDKVLSSSEVMFTLSSLKIRISESFSNCFIVFLILESEKSDV